MTEEQVVLRLRVFVNRAGGQRAWAKANGFSAAYVNDVLLKRRPPAKNICKAIGVERSVAYRVNYAKARGETNADRQINHYAGKS